MRISGSGLFSDKRCDCWLMVDIAGCELKVESCIFDDGCGLCVGTDGIALTVGFSRAEGESVMV
jgi:hypothetical protein